MIYALVCLALWVVMCIALAYAEKSVKREVEPYQAQREKEERVQAKLKAAREAMRERGVKTLLDGHKGWQTIRPMSTEPAAKVLPMRRAK